MKRKLLCVLLVFTLSGLFFSVYATPKLTNETIRLYTVDAQSFRLFCDPVNISYKQGDVNEKAFAVLQALADRVNFSLKDDGLFPPVRNGIKVKVKGTTAYVDFSKKYAQQHCSGTLSEKMTIYSIVNTLTDLPEIDRVHFTVDGRNNRSLKGHMVLDQDYTFDETYVIRAS